MSDLTPQTLGLPGEPRPEPRTFDEWATRHNRDERSLRGSVAVLRRRMASSDSEYDQNHTVWVHFDDLSDVLDAFAFLLDHADEIGGEQ